MSITTLAMPNDEAGWVVSLGRSHATVELVDDMVLMTATSLRRTFDIPLRDLTALASAAAYEAQRRALKAENAVLLEDDGA